GCAPAAKYRKVGSSGSWRATGSPLWTPPPKPARQRWTTCGGTVRWGSSRSTASPAAGCSATKGPGRRWSGWSRWPTTRRSPGSTPGARSPVPAASTGTTTRRSPSSRWPDVLPTATALATQRLAEFLAVVSRAPDVESAIQVATERAARALEAEVAVVLDAHGTVVSSVGFALGRVPSAALREVVAGRGTAVEVPGAGPCRAAVTQLDGSAPGHLVVARSGDDGFNVDEVSLLRGMARVLELTVESLRTFEAERRQAAENARLVTSLRERQRLLEQLSRIQRAITRREPLATILDTITDAAQE